jgi:hypothetical protein
MTRPATTFSCWSSSRWRQIDPLWRRSVYKSDTCGEIPLALAKSQEIPLFDMGLVHSGRITRYSEKANVDGRQSGSETINALASANSYFG